jgi:hypothetical protein
MPTTHDAFLSVRDRLATRGAFVLERLARGGGAETRWYVCGSPGELELVERALRPGSVVTFYFDDPLRPTTDGPALRTEVGRIIAATGAAVIAGVGPEGVHLDARILLSRDDLDFELEDLGASAALFVGAFPGGDGDDDGVNAITVTLPDGAD